MIKLETLIGGGTIALALTCAVFASMRPQEVPAQAWAPVVLKTFEIKQTDPYLCKVWWNHGTVSMLNTPYQCLDVIMNNWEHATVLMTRPLDPEEYAAAAWKVRKKQHDDLMNYKAK